MTIRTVKIATNPDLMTADECAADIGIHPKSLQRWAREGRGPRRVRIGSRAYYFKPEVLAWIENQFIPKDPMERVL